MNSNNHNNPRKPQCTMMLIAMILAAVSVVCSLVSLTMRNAELTSQATEDCSHLHDCPVVYYIEGSVKENTENSVETVESSVETVESTEDENISPSSFVEYQGVLTPSNLTASELEEGLLYELKDHSEAFIAAEKVTGVNAVFLSSIAALESGWGRSDVALSHNNLFGWTTTIGYKTFGSYDECIMYVACKLKELYLDPSGIYFSGYEVSDVNIHYNGSDLWENEVTYIMEDIHIRIAESEV